MAPANITVEFFFFLIILIYKTQFYNTYVTYNTGHLCWQYNTQYSSLQKIQLLAIWATYTANNIILYLRYLLYIQLLTIRYTVY